MDSIGSVREPAVAGRFYPEDADALRATIDRLLTAAGPVEGPRPKALIVPHAGYVYSGPVAASAYARLVHWRNSYSRVILLGPCHREPLRGMALSSADAFHTPLGDVPLDKPTMAALDRPDVIVFESSHAHEHSLEVHLPFLQTILGEFTLVPIVVGQTTAGAVASLIETLWEGPETLIVVSSDLSHHLTYNEARASDADLCTAIETFDVSHVDHQHACGATPVGGLLLAARQHGLAVRTLDMRNSGDTGGDKFSVVGFGAWLFSE